MTGLVKDLLCLLLLFICCSSVVSQEECSDSRIRCSSEDRCIPISYICDGGDDCDDGEDEDSRLCEAWRDSDCGGGSARCRRNGENTCVDIAAYCSHQNPPCEGDLDLRVCQMMRDEKVQRLDDVVVMEHLFEDNLVRSEKLGQEFQVLMNDTISHPMCPAMYTLVNNMCLSVFFVGSVSWGEARAFCQVIKGDLVTFNNISDFAFVADHLKHAKVTSDFWVGGRYVDETLSWTWVNGVPMKLGTPYWAVKYEENCSTRNVTVPELNKTRTANDGTCYNYQQAPSSYVSGKCVSLPYEHYFYMSDNNCLEKKSPLCVFTDGYQFNK